MGTLLGLRPIVPVREVLAPKKFNHLVLQKNVAAAESSWKMNFVENKTKPLEVQGKAIKRIGNFTKSKTNSSRELKSSQIGETLLC